MFVSVYSGGDAIPYLPNSMPNIYEGIMGGGKPKSSVCITQHKMELSSFLKQHYFLTKRPHIRDQLKADDKEF